MSSTKTSIVVREVNPKAGSLTTGMSLQEKHRVIPEYHTLKDTTRQMRHCVHRNDD